MLPTGRRDAPDVGCRPRQGVEGLEQGGGVPVARPRILGERTAEQREQRVGHHEAWTERRQIRHRLDHVHAQEVRAALALERRSPGQQLEEKDAHRIHVRPWVHALAGALLGRHVGGRPHDGARLRERRFAFEVVLVGEDLREAEVEQLHVVRIVGERLKEDVGGLQIAVQHTEAVGERQPPGDGARDLDGCLGLRRTVVVEEVGQGTTLE